MIDSIEREGTKVIIRISTGLDVTGNVLHFKWDALNEVFAELLKHQLWEQERKFKKEIAKQPHFYLDPEEISALKSKLVKEWNGSKHCWKWYGK